MKLSIPRRYRDLLSTVIIISTLGVKFNTWQEIYLQNPSVNLNMSVTLFIYKSMSRSVLYHKVLRNEKHFYY